MPIDTYPPQNVSAQTPTLGYAEVTANQGSITSAADLTGLTVTVTVPAGRRIRVIGKALAQNTGAGNVDKLFIMEGATILQTDQMAAGAVGVPESLGCFAVIAPSAGIHTYKLQSQAIAGTMTMVAGVGYPAFILVEDITGSQLPVLPQSVPVGLLAQAQNFGNGTTFTTLTSIPGSNVNVVVPAGRTLRVRGKAHLYSSNNNDRLDLFVLQDGTVLNGGMHTVPTLGVGNDVWVEAIVSPSAGAHTYTLSVKRDGGGTGTVYSLTADSSTLITVEDITPTPAPGQGGPGSTLGYAEVGTNQSGITTTTDLTGLTVTVTVPDGRRIRITGSGEVQNNTVNTITAMTIREGGTTLKSFDVQTTVINNNLGVQPSVVLTPSAGSHTYKLTMAVSGGTALLAAGANNPAFILVEDITGAVWPAGSTVTAGMIASEAWTDYTPSHSNISVGNGTQIARYQRLGRTICVYYRLTRGSSTSFTGGIGIGLPFAASASAGACGAGHYLDFGTNNWPFNVYVNPNGTVATPLAVAGGGFDATTPITWTTSDMLEFSMTYEAVS